MPPNLENNANNLHVLADQAAIGSRETSTTPIDGSTNGIQQLGSPTSVGGSQTLSDISSITEVSQRTQATRDPPEVLVESDDEEDVANGMLVPDDGSIVDEEDFSMIVGGTEEAEVDRLMQLCSIGKPHGFNEDEYVSDSDVVKKLMELQPEVKIFGVPDDHVATEPKLDQGEKPFDQVDNPGNWSDYYYRARFNKKTKKYTGHYLPAGAKPVPVGVGGDGSRTVNGWTFHYGGWKLQDEEGDDRII